MLKTFTLLTVALLFPVSADAMMCLSRSTVRKAFDESSVVFSGRVLEVAHAANVPTATLEVLQVWKGPLNIGQLVQTSAEHSVTFNSDGIMPVAGTSLLVYAISSEPYFLYVCSRTGELDSAVGDIRILNKLVARKHNRSGG